MNIHASIIDQRLKKLIEEIRQSASERLNIKDNGKLKSLAFVYLCVKTVLDLQEDEAFDCLTEGGGDFGIDAMHISEEYDGEFTVSLFQGKYHNKLNAVSNFEENAIKNIIHAITHLFDPSAKLNNINKLLKLKIEAARSLIADGYIPQVRVIACNNGLKWNASGQETIDRAKFGKQVTWEHINHEYLVNILQATKPVEETIQLSGKAIIEDLNYSRIMIGKIAVTNIAKLIEAHGEKLLERNIRRYLGLQGNRVNEAIRQTLSGEERNNFYFYNNGITFTCDKFTYNALQEGNYSVRINNLQIINGGQTCMTIYKTLTQGAQKNLFNENSQAYVLFRLYELPSDNKDMVQNITYATNSQNPVDLKDLRANDEIQRRLELDIKQLGFSYHRKRTDVVARLSTDITSGVAAEALLSVWLRRPHQAKFFSREHFGKLYSNIFTKTLNGAQVILAVLIYRIAENRRKRPEAEDPDFVPYASCFIAMQMGQKLLADMQIQADELTHENFADAQKKIETQGNDYFSTAVNDIKRALKALYGKEKISSLQQLSATFRRGDLIEKLNH
jgi:hypothetical protein